MDLVNKNHTGLSCLDKHVFIFHKGKTKLKRRQVADWLPLAATMLHR